MKGFHFYAESAEERGSKSGSAKFAPFTRGHLERMAAAGIYNNVVAVPLGDDGRPLYQGSTMRFDTFDAIKRTSNSPVNGSSADREYLHKRCVRISEDLARKLHPAMFAYLEK